ncbi:MAG TPA: hypothetical protein VGM78_01175, partial [Ilumatobacteraceae bacterium]
ANRVAFGDDAAAAGGLVAMDGNGPCFGADAVADPLTGLVGAALTLDRLGAGGRWALDLSMSGVAAVAATRPVPAVDVDQLSVAAPRARPATQRAPRLGEHTAQLAAEFA